MKTQTQTDDAIPKQTNDENVKVSFVATIERTQRIDAIKSLKLSLTVQIIYISIDLILKQE